MSQVTLSDLKTMGNLGGYTIRLNRHFPFSYTNGRLKRDVIEFTRVGIVDGKRKEVIIFEPYNRHILAVIDTIMVNKTLVARRNRETNSLNLTGKGYRKTKKKVCHVN